MARKLKVVNIMDYPGPLYLCDLRCSPDKSPAVPLPAIEASTALVHVDLTAEIRQAKQAARIARYAERKAREGGADVLRRLQEKKYAKPTEPEPKRDITPREVFITAELLRKQRAQLSGTSTGDTHADHDRN